MTMDHDTEKFVCVFGASGKNLPQAYRDDAYRLGQLLVERNWGCVNGAGSDGLMRACSDGVLDAGGEAVGVIPQFMVDNGWHYDRLTRLVVTPDMHRRKETMHSLSCAVVALAGGCGTLEELLEVITWRQLRISHKPIIILNTGGYYDPLLAMLERACNEGFMHATHRRLWQVAATPLEAVTLIERELREPLPEPVSKY